MVGALRGRVDTPAGKRNRCIALCRAAVVQRGTVFYDGERLRIAEGDACCHRDGEAAALLLQAHPHRPFRRRQAGGGEQVRGGQAEHARVQQGVKADMGFFGGEYQQRIAQPGGKPLGGGEQTLQVRHGIAPNERAMRAERLADFPHFQLAERTQVSAIVRALGGGLLAKGRRREKIGRQPLALRAFGGGVVSIGHTKDSFY